MPRRRPDPARERYWRTLLAQWPAGKLTLAEFCRQHAVTTSAFYFWKTEIRKRDAQARPAFVPVTVIAEPTTAIEVRCPSGHIVTITNGNVRTLHELFAALAEARPC